MLIKVLTLCPSLDDGAADLSAVIAVAEQLREEIDKYTVIVVKSTNLFIFQ